MNHEAHNTGAVGATQATDRSFMNEKSTRAWINQAPACENGQGKCVMTKLQLYCIFL